MGKERTQYGRSFKDNAVKLSYARKNISAYERFKTTTDSDHKDPVCDNLLNREFKPVGPSLMWVSNIRIYIL